MADTISVDITNLSNGIIYNYNINPEHQISYLHQKLAERININNIKLIYNEIILDPELTLSNYITDEKYILIYYVVEDSLLVGISVRKNSNITTSVVNLLNKEVIFSLNHCSINYVKILYDNTLVCGWREGDNYKIHEYDPWAKSIVLSNTIYIFNFRTIITFEANKDYYYIIFEDNNSIYRYDKTNNIFVLLVQFTEFISEMLIVGDCLLFNYVDNDTELFLYNTVTDTTEVIFEYPNLVIINIEVFKDSIIIVSIFIDSHSSFEYFIYNSHTKQIIKSNDSNFYNIVYFKPLWIEDTYIITVSTRNKEFLLYNSDHELIYSYRLLELTKEINSCYFVKNNNIFFSTNDYDNQKLIILGTINKNGIDQRDPIIEYPFVGSLFLY